MPRDRERLEGCIVGLAVGDAMGYPAEFRRREQILREIGPEGITEFLEIQDERFSRPIILGSRKRPGTYTDDTQMSLAVARGLLARGHDELDPLMEAMGREFVLWSVADDNDRSPGGTCMTGCENLRAGAPWREAGVPESKGCGSAMRVAPIGLFYDSLDDVERVARASSLLTHGHPAALEGAAACALLVRMALDDASPEDMHTEVARRCAGKSEDFDRRWTQVREMLDEPAEVALSDAGLGEAWVAEEAAASAMWVAWRFEGDYRGGVLCATNTDGDSDSIACIAGGVLGARLGLGAIPSPWVEQVENSEMLRALADQLLHAAGEAA